MLVYEECLNTVQIAMPVYEEYFNVGVFIYISHITIFTFATSTPQFVKHYQMSPSPSSMAMSFNRNFAISAAVRFGRNSVAD